MTDNKLTRKFPRRKFRYKAGVLHQGQYQLCQAIEIGEGGMLLEGVIDVKEQSLICVNFFIPLKGFVSAMAQVLYTKNKNVHGIKFIDLGFEYRRAIRDYIAQKTTQEAKELN